MIQHCCVEEEINIMLKKSDVESSCPDIVLLGVCIWENVPREVLTKKKIRTEGNLHHLRSQLSGRLGLSMSVCLIGASVIFLKIKLICLLSFF